MRFLHDITVALAFAVLVFVCGCKTASDGQSPPQMRGQAPSQLPSWYGTYVSANGNAAFSLSAEAFEFLVLLSGTLRPNVRISPYTVKKDSAEELILSGVDLKSATERIATYRITRSDDGISLERTDGIFQGPLGSFRKQD